MSKFFKSKKPSVETRITQIPEYQKVRQAVSNKLLGYLNSSAPEPPSIYVPATSEQQEYFNLMRQYGRRTGLPQSYSVAQQEVSKTLTGGYDPTTSLYYKAMRDAAAYNLKDTLGNIADISAGGNRYWSGARARLQQRAITESENNLNRILGNLALQERQNRLAELPYAMQMGRIEEMLPIQRAQYLLDVGDLQRQLEAQRLDDIYRRWLFQNLQWPQTWTQLGLGMIQGEPISIQNIVHRGSPSLFSRIASPIVGAFGYTLGSNLANRWFPATTK